MVNVTVQNWFDSNQNIVVRVGEEGDQGRFPTSLPFPLCLSEDPVSLNPVLTEEPGLVVHTLVVEEHTNGFPHLLYLEGGYFLVYSLILKK